MGDKKFFFVSLDIHAVFFLFKYTHLVSGHFYFDE